MLQHCQKAITWDIPLVNALPWLSEVLDFTQMVMDILKQLKTTVFIIPYNFCYIKIVKRTIPGTPLGVALLLAVRGAGPHPDGHGHPETT